MKGYITIYKLLPLYTRTIVFVRMPLLILHMMCILSLATSGSTLTIKLGLLFRHGTDVGRPNNGWSFENIGSAISMAIEDYQARGGLPNVSFR